jgi:hypothetical protein
MILRLRDGKSRLEFLRFSGSITYSNQEKR